MALNEDELFEAAMAAAAEIALGRIAEEIDQLSPGARARIFAAVPTLPGADPQRIARVNAHLERLRE